MITQSINLRTLFWLSLFTVLALTLFSGQAIAQEADQTEANQKESTAVQQYVPDTYNYTVEECNNVTVLVRKSIQLYDQANDDVSLNEAQIIYAETNIVQDMNASDLIYVGDRVQVNSELVSQYAVQSQSLSEASLAAWQTYADNANFALTDVEATNVGVTENEDGSATVTERDETTGEDVTNNPSDENGENQNVADETNQTEDESGSPVPWLIGAAAIIALWYLLWQRGGEEE